MKRGVKILLSVAVALLLVASGFVVFVSWRSAKSLIHPARSLPPHDPSELGLAFENVSFRAADGPLLAGWWMPAQAPLGTVVFLHGYGDSKNQSLEVAPFLHQARWSVLAFDFRAHGASEGDHTTVGNDEARDVQAAWSWLANRSDIDMRHVALLGFSMGAAAGINAAAQLPGLRGIVD